MNASAKNSQCRNFTFLKVCNNNNMETIVAILILGFHKYLW